MPPWRTSAPRCEAGPFQIIVGREFLMLFVGVGFFVQASVNQALRVSNRGLSFDHRLFPTDSCWAYT